MYKNHHGKHLLVIRFKYFKKLKTWSKVTITKQTVLIRLTTMGLKNTE